MNIQDVTFEKPEGDMLVLIFEKQKQLMEKYHHIEEKQGVGYGILQGKKFDINEIKSQCLLKDFAWRVTEELAEAEECYDDNKEHFFEELSDALHFLTELCITAGITPDDIIDTEGDNDKLEALSETRILASWFNVVYYLGLAMNCLKQKPWKQTHVLTDEKKFRSYIILAYYGLLGYMTHCGLSAEDVYTFYFKKNKVNQFRQDSNY